MRYALALAVLAFLPLQAVPSQQSEYKQADTNYYSRSDIFKADPAAVVLTPDAVTNMGDSYLVTTAATAPQYVYLQQSQDWIEPITPPSMPANLNIPSDVMQVREPMGDVSMALPSAPASFQPVQAGAAIPNGAVLRTGGSGFVAVLFGGVDSVRLAPGTQAAVQMSIAGGKRDVEVDVRSGMVFSKVGQRAGEKQAYSVHTPFGAATAHGTDYVTVVYPQRVDVWVASGTVQLTPQDGGAAQTTISSGREPLKVMRYPLAKDGTTAVAESAESLTALLNFIPLANQKLKALAERTHSGAKLTANETEYIARVRKVPALIRLATLNAPIIPVQAPTPPPKPVVLSTPPPAAKPAPRALPVDMPPSEVPAVATSNPDVTPKLKPIKAHTTSWTSSSSTLLAPSDKPITSLPPSKWSMLPVDRTSEEVAVPAAPKAKPVALIAPAPKAKPVAAPKPLVVNLGPYVAPKAKPVAKANPIEIAGMPPLPKATQPKAKGTKPAVAAATAKAAKAKKTVAMASTTPGEHYLRAKPADDTDLANDTPVVKSVPPAPAAPHPIAAEADPNSLGAPLNPFRMAPLAPRAPEPESSPTSTLAPSASISNPGP